MKLRLLYSSNISSGFCRFFLLLLTISLIRPLIADSQSYPQNYFRSPVDFDFHISGTFAEFRNDHLHSGLDIPAHMRSRVYAVADGWVYRIRIQPSGYGKVIYIAHPNGFLSVYAHLDEYSPKLETYLKKIQYQEQAFELDYYPDSKEMPVKKNEVIAFF